MQRESFSGLFKSMSPGVRKPEGAILASAARSVQCTVMLKHDATAP